VKLSDKINNIYFMAVRRFRKAGYGKAESHKAAMAALNGRVYCRKTGETAHHLTLRSKQIEESNKSYEIMA
jgi:hypothetical protein